MSKKYGIISYETFHELLSKQAELAPLCEKVDQLNVVVKAEGNMDDPHILNISSKIKLYAGTAWWTIHERRKNEHWYTDVF